MRGVTIWLSGRRRHRGDRGAMAPLIAVLLMGGVLLGTAAIVIDVGKVYAEREQLQSGADGAALAAAMACAQQGGMTCDTATALTVAAPVATSNAEDGAANTRFTCGRAGTTTLAGPCKAEPTNMTGCVGERPATGNYIEVQTSTKTADAKTLLPYSVAQTLSGSRAGVTVAACSRAGWGTAMEIPEAFTVMISKCAWQAYTANGAGVLPRPGRNWAAPAGLQLTLKDEVDGCTPKTDNFAALYARGGADCKQPVAIDDWIEGYRASSWLEVLEGALGNLGCTFTQLGHWLGNLLELITHGGRVDPTIVHMAIYDEVRTGADGRNEFKIDGFAPFVPTGGGVGFGKAMSWVNGYYCGPWYTHPLFPPFITPNLTDPCMTGYFVKDSISGPYGGAGLDYGLSGVSISG